MKNLTSKLAEALTDRALGVARFTAAEQRAVAGMLKQMERAVLGQLADKPPTAVGTAFQQRRLESLLRASREDIRNSYAEVSRRVQQDLYKLAGKEATWFAETANAAIGVDIVSAGLSAHQLKALASDTLVSGAKSAEWWSRQAEDTVRRFSDAMRQGVLRGEGVDALVRRVRGTEAAGYTDGVMQASRRQAEALVRTSVQTVSNEARTALYEENTDLVKGVQWVATLDTRTSEVCMALDGKVWRLPDYEPVGHSLAYPGATAHWNCRSTQVAVFRSFKELSKGRSVATKAGGKSDIRAIFERNLRELGMDENKIAQAVMDARSSMDGQVAAKTGFEDWLGSKPESVQDRLLGPGKAELWREGKITLTDLIDQSGRPVPLNRLSPEG